MEGSETDLNEIDVRCVLAHAVDEGIMKSNTDKNKTKYWYFVETKPAEKKDEV